MVLLQSMFPDRNKTTIKGKKINGIYQRLPHSNTNYDALELYRFPILSNDGQ